MTEALFKKRFEAIASPKALVHPCVLLAREPKREYWECSYKALDYEGSLKWLKHEFRLPIAPNGEFKLMTRAEAWHPINWTVSPFTYNVWINEDKP